MNLTFIIVGLMCNSLGCYWAPDDPRDAAAPRGRD